MAAEEFAPAKVNLTLHVTGQRADGYHLLDSLVVFVGVGDRLAAAPADGLTLRVVGPEAAGLGTDESNLVMRAARLFGVSGQGSALVLDKHLPVASGIGGGSADAAAALRILARVWDCPLPAPEAVATLGADVPVCLAGRPARMSGIGEVLAPVPDLPPGLALLLVNPRHAVATSAVFGALVRRDNPGMAPLPGRFADARDLAGWLSAQRNDLEAPARMICPDIATVLGRIAAEDCLLARMSGSGATCFGLFADLARAKAAAARIAADRPEWWVRAAPVLR
jgi:4-diphosphocytidyl-2-C-methyl-D-erythritol kinase